MKIQYMSDLHLEFYSNGLPATPKKVGDVLVLAGDIHIGANAIPWIEDCARKFDHVFYITGNHEYYGGRIDKVNSTIPASLAGYSDPADKYPIFDPITNVTFLNNTAYEYEGINFIGSTLWSKASQYCVLTINDFKKINYKYPGGYGKFSPDQAQELFYTNKLFIKMAIKNDMPNVIITHHAPSYSSIHDAYLTPGHIENNTAFATDILNEFEQYNISAWIHGHMHNSSEYIEYGVPVYCNPYGYENYEVNPEFSWEKTIEVKNENS